MDKLGIKRIALCIFILTAAVFIVLIQYFGLDNGKVSIIVPEGNKSGNGAEIFDADKWSVFSERTAEDIVGRYKKTAGLTDEEELYDSEPEAGAVFNVGMLSEAAENSLISDINYYRWLEGVPEILITEENCDRAQAAAFYAVYNMKDVDAQERNPKNTGACSEQNFIDGLENIVKPTTFNTAVRDGLCGGLDFSEKNVLGTRMAMMSYKNSRISLGYCSGVFAAAAYQERDSMIYAFASYPSPGMFPGNDIDKELSAWHIELNNEMIVYDEVEDICIQITDMTDGTVYSRTLDDGIYVKEDLIVFYPPKEKGTMYKHKYQVLVYGMKTISGKNAVIKYTVDFFDRAEYEHSEIISVMNDYKIIQAPAGMPNIQLESFFPEKVQAELDNGRVLDIDILNWAQCVSEDEGLDEDKYIAVIDESGISEYIGDLDNMLRNIGIRIVRYQGSYSIVCSENADGRYELTVKSAAGRQLSDISWYYADGNGEVQFIECAEHLYIDGSGLERTYIAAARDTKAKNILYIASSEY